MTEGRCREICDDTHGMQKVNKDYLVVYPQDDIK